jgi:hypothetical protein
MSNNCSIKLKVDKLPKIINKIEYFMFRAMEQKGMDFYKISQQPKTVESIEVLNKIREGEYTREQLDDLVGKKFASILVTASNLENQNQIGNNVYQIAQMVHLFDTIKNSLIPSYIADYIEDSNISKEDGDEQQAKDYKTFATNLQSLITIWDQIAPNFLRYSDIFNVKAKFNLDDDNLVDLNDIADDEKKIANKMVFDKPANEIDPIDDINKAVELFIKSIPLEDKPDEYGFTSSVNYSAFTRQMFSDLENSIGMNELLEKLAENQEKVPGYKYLLDKLVHKEGMTREESQFRINFRNSFVKAFVPIFITSIEEDKGNKNIFKVTEAASGKTNLYERIVASNFALRGMPVIVDKKTGETINLAHEEDGTWLLDKTDIPKIRDYITKFPAGDQRFRDIQFLKGLGFEFSEKTEKEISLDKITYIKNHFIKVLESKAFVTSPIKDIKKDVKDPENKKDKYGNIIIISEGQNNAIADIIAQELKNNVNYNIEKSVITAEGTRMHAIQLHNNFTVLNKYLSDPKAFPDLKSITDNEPSMFWLDPEKNPAIKNSLFLNSLFFFDPTDMSVDSKGDRIYGRRRRVVKKQINNKNTYVYSASEGEFVRINLVNTGGLQLKLEGEFGKEGSSSTSLNEFDKIMQDLHNFMPNKKSFNSMLRLGDKSTDLGVGLNYCMDVNTGQPALAAGYDTPVLSNKPLASVEANANISVMIKNGPFLTNITNGLQDFIDTRYLGKKGFYDGLSMASKNILSTWGYFDGILSSSTKKLIDDRIDNEINSATPNLNNLDKVLEDDEIKKSLEADVVNYFTKTGDNFYNKILAVQKKTGVSDYQLTGRGNLRGNLNSFILNSFITDMEQMKIFFGDAIYFKDFHKRASKDSATGVFAFVDDDILNDLNDEGNAQGIGANTNLSAKRLIERLFEQKKITAEERNALLSKQRVTKSFRSAVLDDIKFQSEHAEIIAENIEKLRGTKYLPDEMENLYDESISKVIEDKYNGKEGDGQGKCTFDFYRIMSRLTSQWSDEQEQVYKKIIEYNHYDELADEETDPTKRTEYIQQRDAVGYDPTEPVYFPPKKFQYSGPMLYEKTIDDRQYATAPPVFDKFSLQPLIPTVIKRGGLKTTDWYLARKMEINGLGYVKFESASKVETPKDKETLYEGYDPKNPNSRVVKDFSVTAAFKGEQQLFFNHLKEQMTIDAEVHDHAIFGSQIRKLILMNLDKPEFQGLKDRYIKYIGELAELEKTSLYNEMGISRENGKLKVKDLNKIVEYFFNEIAKKNQDSNVKKALKYDEVTKKFEIPLDAAVQAQILEGIIISAINNRVVRYKTNGSMLVQMAITGSERARLSSDDSAKALEQYGNENLNYFTIKEGKNGEPTITEMDVKISLTGQWLRLLDLDYNGSKIGDINRLNAAIRDENWLKENKKAITLVAYRIPTQGRNFLDVMRVKEFLPAAVGDAIVMPKEVVIKSGSDFDIDKMFVFYPNLDKNGKYVSFNYDKSMLNEDLESKKNDIVSDLSYLKLARRTTINDLNQEFKELQRVYRGALRKDTNAREKLNKLLRRVETIMAVLDAESAENHKTFLSTFAGRNTADDSMLSNLIKSNVSYNLAEHEQWMKETGENIYNPMLWVDTKREGLNTLRNSIENLYNSDVDYLKLTRDQNKEYIDNLNTDLQSEISHVYDKLYAYNHIKENIQNKLFETMQEIILHPANYMELVTPCDDFHIMPILNAIFEKTGVKEVGKDRQPTDYKNTRIIERQRNYEKFLSLLKGKADLGIAAVANTFNVMFQLAKAQSNYKFLEDINTFFDSNYVKKAGTGIKNIDYSSKFDEDGTLKSEFFSEFINAFVDVAKDDYVFAANVVTELSPVMFYMKYAGMSSKKILNFVNQPGIKAFTKNLSVYQNKFIKLNNENKNSARKQALAKTLRDLGYFGEVTRPKLTEYIIKQGTKLGITIKDGNLVYKSVNKDGVEKYNSYFTDDMLLQGIRKDGYEIEGDKEKGINPLSEKGKLVQIAMLLELENQRKQSNSITEAQKFLNFDTNPFSSTYDIYNREDAYQSAINGSNILSSASIQNIKKNSIVSSLDMSSDISEILEDLFPVRNDKFFNKFLATQIKVQKELARENDDYFSDDDAMKLARIAKNDYMTYILQNFIGYSKEGMEFFHETFNTDKSFNEYMTELVQTNKLKDQLLKIKSSPDYEMLCSEYPFIRNIVIEKGENNKKITSFRIVENSSNQVEKESIIRQFEELTSDPDEDVRTFFKNLALYSTFQSGMNTSDISYTSMTPVGIVNKLYGAATAEYDKLSFLEKQVHHTPFYNLFLNNNPVLFKQNSKVTPILDTNNRGKWYSREMPLKWETTTPAPVQVMTPVNTKATVVIYDGTAAAKNAARRKEGVYVMRPNEGDDIPGINKDHNFGNPWSHNGYQGTIKTGTLSKEEAKALGTWKGDVTSTAISEAAINYELWLKGDAFQDVEPERRKWILEVIGDGRLDNKNLIYFKGGYRSHADILADFVNNRDKSYDVSTKTVVDDQSPGITEVKVFKWNRPSAERGTDADVAMRKDADYFLGEVADYEGKSSTHTSAMEILEKNRKRFPNDRQGKPIDWNIQKAPNNKHTIYTVNDTPGTVMLARNGSLKGKPLQEDTKFAIRRLVDARAYTFIIGDMEGVDTPFMDYLNEVGARYKIYGHGRIEGVSNKEYVRTKKANIIPLRGKTGMISLIEALGAKKTSKGLLNIEGQHYYMPFGSDMGEIDIFPKPGGSDDLFTYDAAGNEIYIGSRKDKKSPFIIDDNFRDGFDTISKTMMDYTDDQVASLERKLNKPTVVAKPNEVKEVKQVAKPVGKATKIISDDDIAAYKAYLGKSNGKPAKEFFTSATAFKEFYNPSTGKREKAPQSSKWLLQDNGLYDLIDKDSGEIYISQVDLSTGMKYDEPVQPVDKVNKANEVTYNPKGKETQTYTIEGAKILNKNGEEVFKEDSIDRNKIFANYAIKQNRAVVVEYKGTSYVVNDKNKIISTISGKLMKWGAEHGNTKAIVALAKEKFDAKKNGPKNTLVDIISNWITSQEVVTIKGSPEDIAAQYEQNKLPGQTIEEFLKALSCS